MRPGFSAVPFEDPSKAEANLSRLEKELPSELAAPLASLLAHSPDPDSALNFLERYAHQAPTEVLAALARYPTGLTYLVAIFGYSAFLAETFLSEPELPVQFARDRHLVKLKSKEDLMQDYARLATTRPDPWLSAQLARFKRRNYLRIVLKDVLGLSTLGETTFELSALADVILANALAFCYQELEKRYGHPQFRDAHGRIARSAFSIISLGKLGGNELNYSSDIDLLFLYARDGETSGGSEPNSQVSNKEFFVRLAHAVTRTITQPTHRGEVFRVDLRLRPEGDQGDLAISLNSAVEYYEHRAREWELQMLIKARHSAGEARLTREFLRSVEAYIYGAPTNFEAVEAVLATRERISKKLRKSPSEALDVKLHRGGIRDIEFLTQCLQRLYGGRDRWIRSGGTLFALRKLYDKGFLSDADFGLLTSSYEFFRKVEHRIQLEMGKQSHRVPAGRAALGHLARRVGHTGASGSDPGTAFVADLRERFDRVDRIYQRLIHPPAETETSTVFELQPLSAFAADQRSYSFESSLAYLDMQAPELARIAREVALSERSKRNITKFFTPLLGSSEHFRTARLHPEKFGRALEVVGASEYLGGLLIHHPEELAALEVAGSGIATPLAMQLEMGTEASPRPSPFPWVGDGSFDFREKMAMLRRDYRSNVLALGASDLTHLGSVFGALNRWSNLAAQAVESALAIACQALEEIRRNEPARLPFMILGLGRLGLNEFDLASDADLVFVASEDTMREEIQSLTRLAEKTIDVLSSYTREGTVFVVDTRLRPRGREGELVVTENALVNYLAEAAQAWEALTYLKACPVAGNLELAGHLVERLERMCFDRFSDHPDLEGELHQMRRRLEREMMVPPSNTKTAPGGYYDVDFAVSYLRLRNRVRITAGTNMAEQIARLSSASLMAGEDARVLAEGAAFLRSVDHAIRLTTGKVAEGLPERGGYAAEEVEGLARRWGLVQNGVSLASKLRETQQGIRYVYRRLIGSE
jgi:glutamate-ammonia-ligase adenylyltransferase